MQTLLIPQEGEPFLGEQIPDDSVGGSFMRISHQHGHRPARVDEDLNAPVQVHHYQYKGVVVRRGGQPCIAIYEQV